MNLKEYLNLYKNNITKKKFLTVLLILFSLVANSQKIEKKPSKAALYSTIVPGLGQAYTKKYWKIPIIYAGLITSGYYIADNFEKYNLYKNTFINRLNGENNDQFINVYSNNDLQTLTSFYRRNSEVSSLLFLLMYILNILDASVNAHLINYDISENISINLIPRNMNNYNYSIIDMNINL
tara:strand:- start:41416 stop:41958 length:543 start_codon:yes stop_codon:yes gene_type:complete